MTEIHTDHNGLPVFCWCYIAKIIFQQLAVA